MLFNSLEYALFLPLVFIAYWQLSERSRTLLLLVASCIFYAAFVPKYLLILFAIIGLDYAAGLAIERYRAKRLLLAVSLVANISVLFFFKYFNFFTDNLNALAGAFGWNYSLTALKIVLPIGLSFHTFQSMSYTIEVFLGRQKAEKNFLIYSLYVLYFPQLVAGPIERPQNLLHQFHGQRPFRYEQFKAGLQLIAVGLLKKCVVADTLATLVNVVYEKPNAYDGLSLWIAMYFFSIQIFCDFSGYSDIARGSSKLFGVELMVNFDKPYLSASVGEFWRRWHISLSTWFRDYLYIPLGGNRGPQLSRIRNLLIVFLVSGLWHGANWTFVIWGALHWFFLTVEQLLPHWKVPHWLKTVLVFHIVTLAWVFFRASNATDALTVLGRIFSIAKDGTSILAHPLFWEALSIALLFMLFQFLDRKWDLWRNINKQKLGLRWTVYAGVVFAFFLFGQFTHTQFIYFQF